MIDVHDLTLCENFEDINQKINKSLNTLTIDSLKTYEKIKAENARYRKNPFYRFKINRRLKELQKQKAKNEALDKLTKNVKDTFTTYFKRFTTILSNFTTIFKHIENIGLRSYTSNFPKKKNKQLKGDIEMLSRNQTFIKDFINMITPLKDDADDLYDKVFKDFVDDDVIDNDIIPQIKLLNSATPLEIVSIDMDLYKDDPNPTIFFNVTYDTLIIEKHSPYNRAINNANILCIQNIEENVDIKPITLSIHNINLITSSFTKVDTTVFVPICKSGCGERVNSDDNTISYTHYNVIYVKADLFDPNEINIYRTKIKDQSSQFKLSNIDKDINDPTLTSSIIEEKKTYFNKNNKSFAAISIMIDVPDPAPPPGKTTASPITPPPTIKKGITIVSTELIGSRQSDLQYYKEISGVTKNIDILECRKVQSPAKTFTGLQHIQYIEIVNEIVKYTSYKPNFICGSIGFIPKTLYDTLTNPTPIIPTIEDEITKLFTDTYITVSKNTIVSGTPDERLQEFKNYFVETDEDINRAIIYNDYNINNAADFTTNFKKYFEDEKKFKNLTSFIIEIKDIKECPENVQVGGVSAAKRARILKLSKEGKPYSHLQQRKNTKKNIQASTLQNKLSKKNNQTLNNQLTSGTPSDISNTNPVLDVGDAAETGSANVYETNNAEGEGNVNSNIQQKINSHSKG